MRNRGIMMSMVVALALGISPSARAEQPEGAAPSPETTVWRLRGGGELLGVLIKQTPERDYIDLGSTIVEIPASAVLERQSLREAAEAEEAAELARRRASYDPETGTLTFGGATDSVADTRGKSQQEMLEQVKRSVVLVSNPGGLGTGWLIGSDGRLVTNHHVVGRETYQTVTIFVQNGAQWERRRIDNCKVEAFSSLLDMAVVKLDMDEINRLGIELHPLTIAPPGSLEAGDQVFAVGNPGMGGMVLEHTISEGVASSLQRNFGDVLYLQTTAAVNPGNSGGPLVNRFGEVVGLVTLKASFQEGVAFALPVDYMHHFLRHSEGFAVDDLNSNKGFRYHRPN